MNQGDILVVLKPRWHESDRDPIGNHLNRPDSPTKEESIIKVHSFTPFTFTNTNSAQTKSNNPPRDLQAQVDQFSNQTQPRDKRLSNSHIRTYNVRDSPSLQARKKSPFKMKLFQLKSASDDMEPSTSPYGNNVYSDEDISTTHDIIPIKLNDFQKYITMQAVSTAVTISERELLTLKSHSKLKSATINNGYGGLLAANNVDYRPHKKLTDLAEDDDTEASVIHHDEKVKHNRFYFTLCMDRTSALLKVQELVTRINKIIDDLSFLYSIVVQASMAHQTPSEYIESIKSQNNYHMLSLSTMPQASFINICGGLGKYWSDIDDQRSIIKRVQSALQFSALGSVFMYPKDYAARTKWKVGDAVMIFKQDIAKWCPGKITKCIPRNDHIEIKYAVLKSDTPAQKPGIPPLLQGDEEMSEEMLNDQDEDGYNVQHSSDDEQGNRDSKRVRIETDFKININNEAFDPIKMRENNKSNRKIAPKVTFVSNVSTRGSMSYTPRGNNNPAETPKGTFDFTSKPQHRKQSSRSSKIDIIDAAKLAKIDFVNDTTLETITINRYDRDYVKPMIIRNQKRTSFSVTIDNRVNRTSELLDMVTGLGNAVRLNERLIDITEEDDILAGIKDNSGVESIEENVENKENETIVKKNKVFTAKNVHPIALMLVEVDQLSTKINLANRQSDMRRRQENEYADEKYDEDLIMLKVSKVFDNIDKHFNQYLTTNSQAGSDLASLLESEHTRTDSYLTHRISVNENGKKGMSIKAEAFRYSDNVFALLLHNTDVAKSLMISRFIQKEIIDLCVATTEFRYDEHYLTMSIAIANLHYDDQYTKVIDTYRSWYKRCSDALKTIRYEGGNGITHADILFGVKSEPKTGSPVPSSLKAPEQIGFGIVHGAGSKASEPGLALQFQNSLDERHFEQYAAFRNNLLDDDYIAGQDIAQPPHIALPPNSLGSPTMNSVNHNGIASPSNGALSPQQQSQQHPDGTNIASPTSPTSQLDEKNKTITWITGRLDRKYTFV